jgi:AcrR family transcriptional regulator
VRVESFGPRAVLALGWCFEEDVIETNCHCQIKASRKRGPEAYSSFVPRLWTQTIESHRREVHDAIIDATAVLVAEHGLLGVTMSQIAEKTGIGRATLYKYFPDVESIMLAWHDRQVTDHLTYLAEVRDRTEDPAQRLESVLEAYATLTRHTHGHDPGFAELFHRDDRMRRAHSQVQRMIRDLVVAAAEAGQVRTDVPPEELAAFCVNALAGTRARSSRAAVRRLVSVTMTGLRQPRS